MKKPLVVIAGPTACGKTASSIILAKMMNGEIISGDSMQVYKYMDIGTAKVMPDEMDNIPHYMIDEIKPDEEFNAMIFQKTAKKYISDIYSRNHIPILVGGTGFYINALVYDNNFMETDSSIRKQLEFEAKEFGNIYIFEKLKECDPEYAASIHPNNLKRVIRALEFFMQTGQKLSFANNEAHKKESPYNTAFFVLNMDRKKLYERIDLRVNLMFEAGLLDEFKKLVDMGYGENLVSMQGIGYKELFPYLKGECSLEEAEEKIKLNTRHFAKRQLTWFKNKCDGIWIDVDEESAENTAEKMFKILIEKQIVLGDIQ